MDMVIGYCIEAGLHGYIQYSNGIGCMAKWPGHPQDVGSHRAIRTELIYQRVSVGSAARNRCGWIQMDGEGEWMAANRAQHARGKLNSLTRTLIQLLAARCE